MRSLWLALLGVALLSSSVQGQEKIFEPDSKLKVEARGGAGGEGPVWHPDWGVFTSGNNNIHQLDRVGAGSVFRKGAGTNGLIFDIYGQLVSCESEARRVTRTGPDGKISVLTDNYKGKRYNSPNDITIDAIGRIYFTDPRYGNRDGMEIVIVDEFTGRLMVGRRFSEGLHQAIEAKEGVKIRRENLTLATITFQNFFRMYDKLAGMTGTALTESEEFEKSAVIPVNRHKMNMATENLALKRSKPILNDKHTLSSYMSIKKVPKKSAG